MPNQYLIPANSNKSRLILGFFTLIDAIIFGVGIIFTVAMMFLYKDASLTGLILVLLPALISTFLVLPVPHYHNILTLMGNIYRFYSGRKRYYWRGWCVQNGAKE